MHSTVRRCLGNVAMMVAVASVAVGLIAQTPTRLADTGIDAYVASEMEAQHIPALTFAIIRNGAVVQSGTRGLANVELKSPATADTEFAIASMSKSITASAVMLLAQDGALSLDDPVAKYLSVPEPW